MNRLAEQVVMTLAEAGLTVAVAESCTGGLVGHLLTDVPGSSRVFPGGVVAYGNRPKRELLGVPAEVLQTHGAVSAEAVTAMAEGVRRALGTDVGVAISGITGPTGGSEEKPIGTVFIACAAPSGFTVERHQWTDDAEEPPSTQRERNKQKSAAAALDLVLRAVMRDA